MTAPDILSLPTLLWAAAALAAVCAVLLIAPRLLRAAGLDPARPGRRLAMVEAVAIDPRRRLVLARCDKGEVLLLVGGTTDCVVGWLPGPGAPPAPPPPAEGQG